MWYHSKALLKVNVDHIYSSHLAKLRCQNGKQMICYLLFVPGKYVLAVPWHLIISWMFIYLLNIFFPGSF